MLAQRVPKHPVTRGNVPLWNKIISLSDRTTSHYATELSRPLLNLKNLLSVRHVPIANHWKSVE